jgi:hypothetical protein
MTVNIWDNEMFHFLFVCLFCFIISELLIFVTVDRALLVLHQDIWVLEA